MQIIAFPFALIFFGGIVSLIALADPHHKRSAPRVGLPMFYAGVCSAVLSSGLAVLFNWYWSNEWLMAMGFFTGYVVGMAGGAVLGYQFALKHKRRLIESPIIEADANARS